MQVTLAPCAQAKDDEGMVFEQDALGRIVPLLVGDGYAAGLVRLA
jgi:hypothetical protein